ncbi:putative glycolipid-binding domain-containing protein [Enterovirga rhinocerotis]|uniref:Glycolipid-binding protein n=1 Tax=Enterovirga rhinocerotis TaxID=1339210 RepID=A0A4R7BRU1_9HYPH|nr:putative glycolipid-binding domain-containing protein [Enterovirga rhinocerotis]TDR87973.1 hypothetical protein EV668_3837 [Enterovirga rhinocerotis]
MSFAAPRAVTARWRPDEGDGLEHLTLSPEGDEIVARGVVVGERDGHAYGVDYTIVCDRGFAVRELHLGTSAGMALSLASDGAGHWTNHDGRALPEFDGCMDVDLAGSPFTNTLPIRRIDWARSGGRSLALDMLYVPFDSFVPVRDAQIYTCLSAPSEAARRFRFEAADGSFTADLTVDEDGLVGDYPGLFARMPLPR